MSLALALIRFVNGIADQNQKSAFAQSVLSIADSVGLPRYLVDLRHACTHDRLPSARVLKRGVECALEWLRVNYWFKMDMAKLEQASPNVEAGGRMECDENVLDVLGKYKRLRKAEMRKVDLSQFGELMMEPDTLGALKALTEGIGLRWSIEDVVIALVDDPRLLVPNNPKKRVTQIGIDITQKALWSPVLQALNDMDADVHVLLIESSCHILNQERFERNNSTHCSLASWCAYMLQEKLDSCSHGCKQRLLHSVLQHPNKFTRDLVRLIVPEDQQDAHLKLLLRFSDMDHDGAKCAENVDALITNCQNMLAQFKPITLSEPTSLPEVEQGKQMHMSDKSSIWIRSDEDWSGFALGYLPSQVGAKLKVGGEIVSWDHSTRSVSVSDLSQTRAILPTLYVDYGSKNELKRGNEDSDRSDKKIRIE